MVIVDLAVTLGKKDLRFIRDMIKKKKEKEKKNKKKKRKKKKEKKGRKNTRGEGGEKQRKRKGIGRKYIIRLVPLFSMELHKNKRIPRRRPTRPARWRAGRNGEIERASESRGRIFGTPTGAASSRCAASERGAPGRRRCFRVSRQRVMSFSLSSLPSPRPPLKNDRIRPNGNGNLL